MEGYVTFFGETPKHIIKLEWVKGKKVSFKELRKHVELITKGSVKTDEEFQLWLEKSPLTQDNGFFVDANQGKISSPSRGKKTKVLVESEKVVATNSLEDAQNRLKSLRDSKDPGKIESETSDVRTNVTIADRIKSQTPLGNVFTGDDFNRKPVAHVLNEVGQPTTRTPFSKEEQAAENAKMASLSNQIKVLSEESFADGSYAVVGKDSSSPKTEKKPFISQAHLPRGNSVERSVSVEDIVFAPDFKECFRFVDLCKDPSVLRVARSYFSDNGNQKQVEYIERKLRTIRVK